MARPIRPTFDPSGPFVAHRDFVFKGEKFDKGDLFFSSSVVGDRQLKQLYNARYIRYANGNAFKKVGKNGIANG